MSKPRPIWTEQEDEFLRSNAPKMILRELTEGLETISETPREMSSLRYHLKVIGVTPKKKKRFVWTVEQERFLKDNHNKMRIVDIAKELGLSYSCVNNKIRNSRLNTRLIRVSEWRGWLPDILPIANILHEAGVRLEIESSGGKMAVYARRGLTDEERKRIRFS